MRKMQKDENRVSVGSWFWILILLSIPLVDIITIIVLLCSDNASKRNFAIALVIKYLLLGVFVLILIFLILPLILSNIEGIIDTILDYLDNLIGDSDLPSEMFKALNKFLQMSKMI